MVSTSGRFLDVVCRILFFLLFFLGVWMFASIAHGATSEELVASRKAQLEQELATLEKLIAEQQTLLQNKKGERVTLERDIAVLDAQIKKARLNIRASELAIANLEDDITQKKVVISEIDKKVEREKESLAQILRRTAETDDQSMVEVVFSGKTISEFFSEVTDYEAIKVALQDSFKKLGSLRDEHDQARLALEDQRNSELGAKAIRQQQQKLLADQEAEKARVLKVTKGKEQEYQTLIKNNQRTAAQIRSELFQLQGSSAISLGSAIEFANFASAKTGVRSAFILGILKQETQLGSFLGNCTYNQDKFGKPVMKPTRDTPIFLAIAGALGFDPSTRPVSCSQTVDTWGGAMGPSQFIPSTWASYGGFINTVTGTSGWTADSGLTRDAFFAGPWKYDASKDRLRILRGKQSPSNPWDNQDAFLATALYMQEMGAAYGDYASEQLAAMRYFAGWGGAANPSAYVRAYGDSVMNHTAYYQTQIDTLKQLAE